MLRAGGILVQLTKAPAKTAHLTEPSIVALGSVLVLGFARSLRLGKCGGTKDPVPCIVSGVSLLRNQDSLFFFEQGIRSESGQVSIIFGPDPTVQQPQK